LGSQKFPGKMKSENRDGLAVVSRQPSAVSRQPSAVSRQPSAVSRQPSVVVSRQSSVVSLWLCYFCLRFRLISSKVIPSISAKSFAT